MKQIGECVAHRNFMKSSTCLGIGLVGLALFPELTAALQKNHEDSIQFIGPKKRFFPQRLTNYSSELLY